MYAGTLTQASDAFLITQAFNNAVNQSVAAQAQTISLKQRIQNIWNNIFEATKNNSDTIPVLSDNDSRRPFQRIKIDPKALHTAGRARDPFIDISDHPARNAIIILASHKIVDDQATKFFPQNYIRLGELVKMIINTYAYHIGRTIDFDSLQDYMEFARDNGIVDTTTTSPQLSYNTVYSIITNMSQQFKVPNPTELVGDDLMTRWEFADYLVDWFDLQADDDYLIQVYASVDIPDIQGNIYQEAIETLARANIIDSTQAFYPDDRADRSDFIKRFATLYGQEQVFMPITNTSIVADVTPDLLPYVQYGIDNKLRDYLLVVQRQQYFLYPDEAITKHEVYHIIQDHTNRSITYNQEIADRQYISRGELAQIMVDAFALDNAGRDPVDAAGQQVVQFVNKILSSL